MLRVLLVLALVAVKLSAATTHHHEAKTILSSQTFCGVTTTSCTK